MPQITQTILNRPKILLPLFISLFIWCANEESKCEPKYYKDFDLDKFSDGQTVCQPTDGYYTSDNLISTYGDCDDLDREVNPSQIEICGDKRDNNCNGMIDENCNAFTHSHLRSYLTKI